jgi:hypothetical protein
MTSTYWFFRAGPQGWETITASRTAGCAQVHKADPQFPARLCARPQQERRRQPNPIGPRAIKERRRLAR